MRYLLFLVCLCAGLMASAQEPFIIEGRVSGVADNTMLQLYRNEGRTFQVVDTAYVMNGAFRFNCPLREEEEMAVMGPEEVVGSQYLTVLGEPGITVRIVGENNLIYTWSVESPVPEQQEMERYKQANRALWEECQLMGIEQERLRRTARGASEEEIQSLIKEFERLDKTQDSMQFLIYDKTLSLMASSAPSPVFLEELNGIGLMIFHYGDTYGGLRARAVSQYERLSPEQKASEKGQELALYLFPPTQVKTGDPMADAELPGPDGRLHKLSDYRGKYILLDFWSSGCGPCIQAMPELKEVSEQYRDRLTIIGISSDDADVWERASEKYGVSWVNLNAPGQSEIAARYGVNGIPHQVLISPEGIVTGSWVGYGKGHIKKQLEEYLPEAE